MKYVAAILLVCMASPHAMAKTKSSEIKAFKNLGSKLRAMNDYTVTYREAKKTVVMKKSKERKNQRASEVDVKLVPKKSEPVMAQR